MAIKKLVEYIHECKKKEVHPSKIREILIEAGWAIYEIEEAFKETVQAVEKVEHEIVNEIEEEVIETNKKKGLPNLGNVLGGIVAVIAIVFIIVGISLAFRGGPNEETPSRPKVCEAGIDCLTAAAGRCEPSSGIIDLTLAANELAMDESIEVRIIGPEEDKCRIEFSVINFALAETSVNELTAQNFTNDQITAAQDELLDKVTPPSSCLFLSEHFLQILYKWDQKNSAMRDFLAGKCEGQIETNCALRVLSPYVDLPLRGKTQLSVTGFTGKADAVSWRSEDPSIVSVEQGRGTTTNIKAKNYGSTKVVVTDSVAACSIEVLVEVV